VPSSPLNHSIILPFAVVPSEPKITYTAPPRWSYTLPRGHVSAAYRRFIGAVKVSDAEELAYRYDQAAAAQCRFISRNDRERRAQYRVVPQGRHGLRLWRLCRKALARHAELKAEKANQRQAEEAIFAAARAATRASPMRGNFRRTTPWRASLAVCASRQERGQEVRSHFADARQRRG
jgi:hypothetical protein